MTRVSVSQRVAADADAVWELIGDFNGLPAWAAGVAESSVEGADVGAVRSVTLQNGRRLKERLESLDEVGRSYSYSIVEGAVGMRDYLATLKVWANRDGSCEVVWSAEFEVVDAPEDEVRGRIEAFYRTSLERVRDRFAQG
jgi:carbon monoxide dehydrogenase subunit G